MKWTTELPKKSGWYWVRSPHNHVTKTMFEVIFALYEKKYMVIVNNYTVPVDKVAKMYGEWAGPMPDPEEN